MSIYKACDIRGHFGTEVTTHHARRLGQAVAALYHPGKVIVGGDGRVSTPPLKEALILALVQNGCQVFDIGIVPTPVFYFARQELGIETGVQVTASHNPPGDNGFKITLGSLPITEEQMHALASWMENQDPAQAVAASTQSQGRMTEISTIEAYLDSIAAFTPNLSGMKIVVDCANGVAGLVARQAWGLTGAEVRFLFEGVDGTFPNHPPNPAVEKNLNLLKQAVIETRADIGIAYDGDADRVAIVDELGAWVTNDKVIVLFAEQALARGHETIVYDQKCSRVVPEAIRRYGGKPAMARSGHTFIKTAFLQLSAAYAGELSGHHFFRQTNGDDGLFASLVFARLVKESRLPLSKLAQAVPSYPVTPDIRLPMEAQAIQQLLADLEANLADQATVQKIDGIRLEFGHGWVLVRPSVTESVVSLRFEGQDEESLGWIMETVSSASDLINLNMIQSYMAFSEQD